LQNSVEDRSNVVAERPGSLALRRSADEGHDNNGSKPEGSQREPSEDSLTHVVDQLDVEEEHADEVVSGLVHAAEMEERVNTGGEGTVQPTTTLTDELGSTFRHIGFTLGGLDVGKMPLGTCLGDQLETKNTIFGQKHVLLENVHALDTLLSEDLGERVVTVEVLLEGTTHDSAVAVSRESTRQHRDVSEGRFQWFVENVTDLVLEVLRGDKRVKEVFPALFLALARSKTSSSITYFA
jgi:hypothetical protein